MNIETELRTALADEAAFANDLHDPYSTFIQREAKRRRTRRLRVATAVATVIALAAAAVGFQAFGSRNQPTPAAPTTKALLDSPLRGSLAQDQTFVKAMTTQVSKSAETRLLYASDLGTQRLVLAYLPAGERATVDRRAVEGPQYLWLTGPRGASPKRMIPSQNGPVGPASTLVVADNMEKGAAVTVGPEGYTATLSNIGETYYSAQGTVEQRTGQAKGAEGSGLVETSIPLQAKDLPRLKATLTQHGKTFAVKDYGATWSKLGTNMTSLPAVIQSALHGRDFDSELLKTWLTWGLSEAHLPLPGTEFKVLWVGGVQGKKVAVFTLQQPGQGVVAFAFGTVPDGTGTMSEDLSVLLPAKGIDTRPIAYRLTKNHRGGPHVIVVAPEKAARVTVTPAGGKPVEVKLSKTGMGTVTIDPEQEATATAYAADGSEMGSTPVRSSAAYTTMIGDTPGTRVGP